MSEFFCKKISIFGKNDTFIQIKSLRAVLEIFYEGLTRNPEIENTPSGFYPKSEDWGEFGIPNLAQMFLIKCY